MKKSIETERNESNNTQSAKEATQFTDKGLGEYTLTTKDIAARFGGRLKLVYELIAIGALKAIRGKQNHYLVSEADYADYLESIRRKPERFPPVSLADLEREPPPTTLERIKNRNDGERIKMSVVSTVAGKKRDDRKSD